MKYNHYSPRTRLTLTYLAIIMVLSISFSVVFYHVSTSALQIELQDSKDGTALKTEAFASDTKTSQSVTAPKLNAQLQKQLSSIREAISYRLVFFNIGALLGGGLFSYYLARRTLRPIETAMEEQSRFTSDASHELRTPLTALQTEIEVTLQAPKLTLARAKAALRSNHQEVIKLKELSESLLDLAHKPLNEQEFTPLALDEIVNEAINRVIISAQTKRITITETVPKIIIKGNQQSLIQAIVALLDNAIKYSPSSRVITIDSSIDIRKVHLMIRDEGPGIQASDLPHIFDRFYRADTSRSSQTTGHGLGLPIAKKIIDQHHGELTVSSTFGHGTVFTITLPS